MEIKTKIRYHLTPVRMAIISKSIKMCWQGCGEKGTLVHCWWECRLVQPLWKTAWRFLKKLKMKLLYNPVIPLVGKNLKKTKTLIWKNIYTRDHCSTVYNTQDTEATQVPINRRVNKKAVVHIYNVIVLSHKKEGNLTICDSMDKSRGYLC